MYCIIAIAPTTSIIIPKTILVNLKAPRHRELFLCSFTGLIFTKPCSLLSACKVKILIGWHKRLFKPAAGLSTKCYYWLSIVKAHSSTAIDQSSNNGNAVLKSDRYLQCNCIATLDTMLLRFKIIVDAKLLSPGSFFYAFSKAAESKLLFSNF